MIHRLISHTENTAAALQNAADLRRGNESGATQRSRFNLADILGRTDWAETSGTVKASSTKASPGGFSDAIATATTPVVEDDTVAREPATPNTVPARTTPEPATESTTTPILTTIAATTNTATTTTTPTVTPAATTTPAATVTPGVEALVTAIMNGSFKPTYDTSVSQLQEITPTGTAVMPNFYYASDQTAAQLASLLGGTVVQKPPFGATPGYGEPEANFIQLPNGQTFNAADLAYYAKTGSEGAGQLTADITSTINQGAAWTNYYEYGGSMPSFPMGYVGPPISGMTYPASMIGANGYVINPAMAQSTSTGT
jgi:hypothetical protein